MSQSIAVVDDEANIRETVAFALRREAYEVIAYADGLDAWTSFSDDKLPDLVILDIVMPRMDGLELCRKVRTLSDSVPIIFLTSRDDELDRILGLELGADDYLCKPFSMRELVARVRVLFRRAARRAVPAKEEQLVRVGSLELDPQRFIVRWKGNAIEFTVTEFLMLQALVSHPGHVKARQALTREGYPHDNYVSERTIDSHVKRIRKKFESVDPEFDRIDTVYGMGYRYQPEAAGTK